MKTVDNKSILFILDRAHGKNVKGKRSPDGSFIEWESSQQIINKVKKGLKFLEIPFAETVQEDTEPGLSIRVARANALTAGIDIPILLSFHHNAGGGTGIELFTSNGEDDSDKIAHIIGNRLIKEFPEVHYRKADNGGLGKDKDFTVIAGNKAIKPTYKGVLIEFLFMDNQKDLEMLKDKRMRGRYIDAILVAVCEICVFYKYKNFIIPE